MSDLDVAGELDIDVSEFVGGMEEAGDASEEFADSTAETEDSLLALGDVDTAGIAAGIGAAGIGGAMMSATESSSAWREELGRTAVSMDMSRDSVVDLADSVEDATFPMEDVTQTLDTLARIGVESEEQMEALALAADNVADATGETANEIADNLGPAVQALDGDVGELENNQDAFTTALRETTLSASELGRTLERSSDDLDALGLSSDEAALAIAQYSEEAGKTGRDLRRDFSSAISDAEGDVDAFAEETGVALEDVEAFADELGDGTDVTDEYADAANEAVTPMDRLNSVTDSLTLRFGNFLEPVQVAGPLLAGLGSSFAALSASGVSLTGALAPVAAAVGAIGAPVIAVAAVAGILAFVFRDELMEAATMVGGFLSDKFGPVFEDVRKTLEVWFETGQDIAAFIGDEFGPEIEFLTGVGRTAGEIYGRFVVTQLSILTDSLRIVARLLRGDFSGAVSIVEERGEAVADAMASLGDSIRETLAAIPGQIRDAAAEFIPSLPSASDMADHGRAMMNGLRDGIVDRMSAPVDAVRDVAGEAAEFLTSSDAEKGPLSNLTDRGRAIPETLAEGIRDQGGLFRDAVEDISEDAMRGLTMRDVEQHLEELDDADPDDLDADSIADVDPSLLADVALEQQAEALAEEQALAETQEIVDERLATEFGEDIEAQQVDIARPMKNAAIPGLEEAAEETDWSVEQMAVAEADADELIDTSERQLLAGVGDSEAPLPSEGTDATATSPGDGPVVDHLERLESMLADLPGEFASVMDGLILVLSGSMDLEGDVVSPDELRGELKRVARQAEDNR